MATNNSINSGFDNNSDGFDISGGTTPRKLTVTGGDLTLSSGGANTYTFPASTDTLVGRASTDILTNKDLSSSTNVFPAGSQVQYVFNVTGAVATGATTIPHDDTIPQITEGDQYMTQAITPKATTNILVIEVIAFVSNSAAVGQIGAIFQDSTANAIAAGSVRNTVGTEDNMLVLRQIMVAGTTSATTFKFRSGGDSAGTTTFNGDGGARKFGGITLSSMSVTEIKV